MILRLLNAQGVAGLAASLALAVLLLLARADARHWKKQSGQYEQLYRAGQAALAGTVANYRAAADRARAADQANLARVSAQQRTINERTSDDYEARLAAARSLAQRLRGQASAAATDPRRGGTAPVPGLSAPAAGAAQAAGEDGFSFPEREVATEQAIQLDELIKWVRKQHEIVPDPAARTPQEVDSNQP